MKYILLLLCATITYAQNETPKRFIAAGLGFQSYENQKPAGWMGVCNQVETKSYLCAVTDYSDQTSSVRAGIERIIWQYRNLTMTMKADAGAATSVSGGVGGSYGAGGTLVYKIGKVVNVPNFYLVGSASWLHSNVVEGANLNRLFSFGDKTTIRIGFMRSF